MITTAKQDERIVVMTAENRALVRSAPRQLGNRFIDTGITEQTMVGMAAGLALRGRIPIVHALAPFLTMRAFEFIRTDVGIAHLPVKLSGYIPGFLSDGNGPTHQSIEDVAIMRGIPGMEVYCPADEDDLVKVLPAVWGSTAPAYVRINHKKGSYDHSAYVPGKAEIVAKGKDVTLLVYGFLFENALQAKELLEQEGLSVGLINMRSLKPVDEEAVVEAALASELLVTIEDHLRTGGLYSIVAEVMLRHRVRARRYCRWRWKSGGSDRGCWVRCWRRKDLRRSRSLPGSKMQIQNMPNKIAFNEDYPVITESDKLYERALPIMTPVTQTLAKGPGQYVNGVAPKYLKRGKGAHVWDVDGNEYLDYNMGIGPLSLGYAYPRVDEAIIAQLKDGITFSMMHELEVELAELIHRVIPNAESIRISKTGADVTSAAVRVARAYTKRNKVLCCGYHGWHDWYIAVTSRNAGIPTEVRELSATFEYNDIGSVRAALDEDTACVILEPFVFEAPKNDFLKELKELCTANGTLLDLR